MFNQQINADKRSTLDCADKIIHFHKKKKQFDEWSIQLDN